MPQGSGLNSPVEFAAVTSRPTKSAADEVRATG
jgi:hypothetical protein